jgi:hypothetical protein
MIGVVTTKEGVLFQKIAPAGFRILSAIDQVAETLSTDLVITSGTDGTHSGPDDPHHRGEAYDVRSRGFSPDLKQQILDGIMRRLGFDRFYGFLEAEGTDNEHFHFQVRKGTAYP